MGLKTYFQLYLKHKFNDLKKNKHIIILLVLFTGLVVFEYNAPKPVDWKPSFKSNDKIPFGSYIPYEMLESIFPDKEIRKNKRSIFQTLNNQNFQDASFIVVTERFEPQKVSLETLLDYVAEGNKAFVSATYFGKNFSDTIGFRSEFYFSDFERSDSLPYNFINKHLKGDNDYWIKSGFYNFHFDSVDVDKARAIATIDSGMVNYFRIPFGQGEFFLHNQPYAFTNYNMLIDNNAEYAYKVLSYLDNEVIIWDESFKPGVVSSTPLRYILSSESLSKSYYLILILAVFFLFFSSKRLQRKIPIIKRPENSSLEFAKTLGNLYLSGKNHKDIALKKYNYWIDFLREKYYINIDLGDEPDVVKISEKTGVKEELVEKIIKSNIYITKSASISSEQLLNFNKTIEKFHAVRK